MTCLFVIPLIFFRAVLVEFDNWQRGIFAELRYTQNSTTLNVYTIRILLLLTYNLKHSFASVLCQVKVECIVGKKSIPFKLEG